jgi:hypothetical protein
MDGWGVCMSRAMEGHSELMNGTKVSPDTYTLSIFHGAKYFHIHHFMALNPKTLNPTHPSVCKKLIE